MTKLHCLISLSLLLFLFSCKDKQPNPDTKSFRKIGIHVPSDDAYYLLSYDENGRIISYKAFAGSYTGKDSTEGLLVTFTQFRYLSSSVIRTEYQYSPADTTIDTLSLNTLGYALSNSDRDSMVYDDRGTLRMVYNYHPFVPGRDSLVYDSNEDLIAEHHVSSTSSYKYYQYEYDTAMEDPYHLNGFLMKSFFCSMKLQTLAQLYGKPVKHLLKRVTEYNQNPMPITYEKDGAGRIVKVHGIGTFVITYY